MSEETEVARGYPGLRRRIERAVAATEYNAARDSIFEFGPTALLIGRTERLTAERDS